MQWYNDYYLLGIMWSIGSWLENEKLMVFRHKDKHFLEVISRYFGYEIYEQAVKNYTQYVLKVYNFDIGKLVELGWNGRNADKRELPFLSDYRDFLRAYIELHSGLGYSVRYRRKPRRDKYKALRLRIYGNEHLVEGINKELHKSCRTSLKTIQDTKLNNKTFYVAYTSLAEIERIFNWLWNEKPYNKRYWADVEEKLNKPVLYE